MGRGSYMKRVLKTVGKAAAGIGAAAAAAGLVLRSDLAAEGVKAGITLCLETVIPSLFAFMVLSDFLAAGRGTGWIFAPFKWMARVYHLPDAAAAALALGLVGGYPVGARMAAGLKREGRLDGREASALLCTAYGPSPTFLAGIGAMVFGNRKIGLVIWLRWSWRHCRWGSWPGGGCGGEKGRGKSRRNPFSRCPAVCRERAVGDAGDGGNLRVYGRLCGAAAVSAPAAGGGGQVRRGLL